MFIKHEKTPFILIIVGVCLNVDYVHYVHYVRSHKGDVTVGGRYSKTMSFRQRGNFNVGF